MLAVGVAAFHFNSRLRCEWKSLETARCVIKMTDTICGPPGSSSVVISMSACRTRLQVSSILTVTVTFNV